MSKLLNPYSAELAPIFAALRKIGLPDHITYLKIVIDASHPEPIEIECRFYPTVGGEYVVEDDKLAVLTKTLRIVTAEEAPEKPLIPMTCTRPEIHDGPCNGYPRVIGFNDQFICCNGMALGKVAQP